MTMIAPLARDLNAAPCEFVEVLTPELIPASSMLWGDEYIMRVLISACAWAYRPSDTTVIHNRTVEKRAPVVKRTESP
eukprot:COSAG02_NODE_5046_length_4699_cov_2.745652_3_plen_78_part_00